MGIGVEFWPRPRRSCVWAFGAQRLPGSQAR